MRAKRIQDDEAFGTGVNPKPERCLDGEDKPDILSGNSANGSGRTRSGDAERPGVLHHRSTGAGAGQSTADSARPIRKDAEMSTGASARSATNTPVARAIQTLCEEDWDEITDRVIRISAGCYWENKDAILMAEEPVDFGQEVVRRFLDGKYDWNPAPEVANNPQMLKRDIGGFLANKAKGQLRNTKQYVRYTRRERSTQVSFLATSPDEASALEYVQLRSEILGLLEDDEEAHEIARVIIDEDIYKPRELADRLGISRSRVYNAFRRLRRRMNNLNHRLLSNEHR